MKHPVAFVVGSLVLTACAGAPARRPERLSASQHDAEAARHDREAAEHQRLHDDSRRQEGYADVRCYDTPIPDPTSGTEPIRVARPCWTAEQVPGRHRLEEAEKDRREAARHRAVAATMRRAEREACRGLGEQEVSHSPFFHRDDIVRVEELRDDDDVLRGARVVFRRVAGLDVAWMDRALRCHQARADAAGYDPKVMSYCPLMVAPTSYAVSEVRGEIVVTLAAAGEQDIALVVGRALDLTLPGYRGPHH